VLRQIPTFVCVFVLINDISTTKQSNKPQTKTLQTLTQFDPETLKSSRRMNSLWVPTVLLPTYTQTVKISPAPSPQPAPFGENIFVIVCFKRFSCYLDYDRRWGWAMFQLSASHWVYALEYVATSQQNCFIKRNILWLKLTTHQWIDERKSKGHAEQSKQRSSNQPQNAEGCFQHTAELTSQVCHRQAKSTKNNRSHCKIATSLKLQVSKLIVNNCWLLHTGKSKHCSTADQ